MKIPQIILILLSAIPLALLAHYLTRDEEQIYKKYFNPLLWLIAIFAAIFFTFNIIFALTLTFIFILILIWKHADKITQKFK